jgi:beta-galactosidase
MTQERAELLKAYVAAGGTLVVACRSGYKDLTGKCVMDHLPGLLSELTGTDIPEYSFIAPDAGTVTIDWDGTTIEANVFTDLLEPIGDATLVGTYTSDYYAGSGALVCNQYGEGTAYYYGTAFNEAAAKVFLEKLGVSSPYRDIVEVPESCEIAVRSKEGQKFLFVLNYDKKPAEITLHTEGVNLYTGEKISGKQMLEAYGTLVVKL